MKAIIFDLFDTLVHIDRPSNPYRQLFAQAAAKGNPRKFAMTRELSVPQLAKALNLPVAAASLVDIETAIHAEVLSTALFPETLAALQLARDAGVTVIVSSNAAMPYGEVKHLLAGHVDYWNFSFNAGVIKPDSRMFTGPAEAFGLRPEDCVVIGDSLNSDGKGAAAAGMRFILLDRSGKHPEYASAENLEIAVSAALALD